MIPWLWLFPWETRTTSPLNPWSWGTLALKAVSFPTFSHAPSFYLFLFLPKGRPRKLQSFLPCPGNSRLPLLWASGHQDILGHSFSHIEQDCHLRRGWAGAVLGTKLWSCGSPMSEWTCVQPVSDGCWAGRRVVEWGKHIHSYDFHIRLLWCVRAEEKPFYPGCPIRKRYFQL